MLCPIDAATLLMSERQGIEIDYCPTCRGVWLDRGELDKLIERSVSDVPSAHSSAPSAAPRRPDERERDDRGYSRDSYERPSYSSGDRRKKKSSWLGEIFEFGE